LALAFSAGAFTAGLATVTSALRLAAFGSTAALNAGSGTSFRTFDAAILIFVSARGLKPDRAPTEICPSAMQQLDASDRHRRAVEELEAVRGLD